MRPRYHNHVSILRWVVSLSILGLAIWIFFNRQLVIDEISLRSYEPTDEIVQLAQDTTMTQLGTRYFYASQPQVEGSEQFNNHCEADAEQSIILGCYVALRIYLYDVTDERLEGVKEVTAAHEMLHAAYDRLGNNEKRVINEQLRRQADAITDERVLALIESYKKTEPNEIDNELHSIIGTEVRDISPELEAYYGRYFGDRDKVVGYAEAYESVFTRLKNEQQELSRRLNELNRQIDSRSDTLNSQIQQLNSDIATFNERAQSGGFATQEAFNVERDKLTARQQALRIEREAINDLIDEFNATREELLLLGGQAQELNKALDSTPNEVPSL